MNEKKLLVICFLKYALLPSCEIHLGLYVAVFFFLTSLILQNCNGLGLKHLSFRIFECEISPLALASTDSMKPCDLLVALAFTPASFGFGLLAWYRAVILRTSLSNTVFFRPLISCSLALSARILFILDGQKLIPQDYI